MTDKTEVVQVRLPKGMTNKIDKIVKTGEYSSRQDYIKHIIRIELDDYDILNETER